MQQQQQGQQQPGGAQQQQQGQQQPGGVQQQQGQQQPVGNDNCVNNGVILPLKGGVDGELGWIELDLFEMDLFELDCFDSWHSDESMGDGPDSDTLSVTAGRLAWGLAFGFDGDMEEEEVVVPAETGMASSSDSDRAVAVEPAER